MNTTKTIDQSPLGKTSGYCEQYNPDLLYPIERQQARQRYGVDNKNLPFYGGDIWNAFELSWLNPRGKPQVCTAEIIVPATSPKLIESKSMKLYFNSFNQSHFDDLNQVRSVICKDFEQKIEASVSIILTPLETTLSGACLDDLDVSTDCYHINPDLLEYEKNSDLVHETVYSDLFKSNCLVTGQPDWATIWIDYRGPKINHARLLKYLVSYRQHAGLHEDCVEQIFMDILQRCKPEQLTVYARYTRRGGIDINPYRSTDPNFHPKNIHQPRQ